VIDFRYHLVSIISIFLALAVGIVLGAGPLQGNLGSQLTDQVAALRTEKQALNDRLTASEKRAAASDDFARAVSGRVTGQRLAGRQAVVIVLPSADGKLVDLAEEAVTTSGASVKATVTINADWFDPAKEQERADAATAATSTLGVSSTLTGDALLDQVLARLTVSREAVTASESRTAALAVLTDAGLIDSSTGAVEPSDLAVVVSGDQSGDQAEIERWNGAVRGLVRQLAEGSSGAVVAGPAPVPPAGQTLTSDAVAAIRADEAAARIVSTVDHAGDATGPTIVVLALEAELLGQVGHYGTADGATATVPKVATR
jgi:hypothetical protein